MKQTEFNREDNILPTVYNRHTIQPIKRYSLTESQIKFLVEIQKHIAGLNMISTVSEAHDIFELIKRILNNGCYQDNHILTLHRIREKYKFLYENKR